MLPIFLTSTVSEWECALNIQKNCAYRAKSLMQPWPTCFFNAILKFVTISFKIIWIMVCKKRYGGVE